MIPYSRQDITNVDIDAVAKALELDYLTTGPLVSEFEKELCSKTGAAHAIVCANGTAALHLACLALDIESGNLGIAPAISFLATANCIEYCGARTDFIDINPDTLCLDVGALEDYCRNRERPAVVVPVSFAGVPADLPKIFNLAQTYGFKVIEDAAHSLGSSYTFGDKVYMSGSCAHSDLAILSFHPVKTITTGEGGAVLTNSAELADRLRVLRSHGMIRSPNLMARSDGPWCYEMIALGFNYRITDFQCALGLSQLRRLADFKRRKQEIFDIYIEAFRNESLILLPQRLPHAFPCYHLFAVQFMEGAPRRLQVYQYLLSKNIQTQVHYMPIYRHPYYKKKYKYRDGKCPMSEQYYSRCLSIPLYAGMSNDQVQEVISELNDALVQPAMSEL